MDIDVLASSSKGNCYRISDGVSAVLLDCGIPIKEIQKKTGYTVSSLSCVCVTHCHQDHIKAAKDILQLGVPVYTSQGTIDASGLKDVNCIPVKALTSFTIGSFKVFAFDTEHDAPEPLGFLLHSDTTKENLLYFTDTYYLKYKFPNVQYMLAECNYSIGTIAKDVNKHLIDRIYQSHMSLEHLIEFLQSNDLSALHAIYLIHLSDSNSDAEMFKKTIQQVTGVEVYVC